MTGRRKQIAVIIATRERDRVREALRAAVGLGLRGDNVSVAFAHPGGHHDAAGDRGASRALATLALLGHPTADATRLPEVLAAACAVEVWT